MFSSRKVYKTGREMCNYLDWELTVDNPILSNFETAVRTTGSTPITPSRWSPSVPLALLLRPPPPLFQNPAAPPLPSPASANIAIPLDDAPRLFPKFVVKTLESPSFRSQHPIPQSFQHDFPCLISFATDASQPRNGQCADTRRRRLASVHFRFRCTLGPSSQGPNVCLRFAVKVLTREPERAAKSILCQLSPLFPRLSYSALIHRVTRYPFNIYPCHGPAVARPYVLYHYA
ncbi:hypothetical protein DFP72DRAFT_585358 [Ephemerocybe angulata]|uniref:Uncharacterized protein n=1 Tax=Ephemerocybe angulata TaxID=980116 RepID=A0A8H6LYV4_9AGAR|nr:hypothetical protein DFP72DRAFT_585358 [Tulosesus angulatus]